MRRRCSSRTPWTVKVPPEDIEGYMLQLDGNIVVDLGDDAYTQGKPHPMIDPAKRIECMQEAVDDESTGVVLLDIMLGYGSHAGYGRSAASDDQGAQSKGRECTEERYSLLPQYAEREEITRGMTRRSIN